MTTLQALRPESELLNSDYYLYQLAEIARRELPISKDDGLIMGVVMTSKNNLTIEFDSYGLVHFKLIA